MKFPNSSDFLTVLLVICVGAMIVVGTIKALISIWNS